MNTSINTISAEMKAKGRDNVNRWLSQRALNDSYVTYTQYINNGYSTQINVGRQINMHKYTRNMRYITELQNEAARRSKKK